MQLFNKELPLILYSGGLGVTRPGVTAAVVGGKVPDMQRLDIVKSSDAANVSFGPS